MPIEILILHAREDRKLCIELVNHLKPLERTGLASVFYEDKIIAGDHYKCSMHMHMQQAHIILALISCHFVASDVYVELEQALLYPQHVSARIIPIILRPVDWQADQFGDIKVLPKNNIPVKSWSDRDYAWTEIVKHIRMIATQLSH